MKPPIKSSGVLASGQPNPEIRVALTLRGSLLKDAEDAARAAEMPIPALLRGALKSMGAHARRDKIILTPFGIVAPDDIVLRPSVDEIKGMETLALCLRQPPNRAGVTSAAHVLIRLALVLVGNGSRPISPTRVPTSGSPAWPPRSFPELKPAHAKKLRTIAELLNVRPQDLLDWTVSDTLKDWFKVPGSGLLDYAKNGLQYQSADERERVLARVEAWQARRKVRALRRKTSMESGVAA